MPKKKTGGKPVKKTVGSDWVLLDDITTDGDVQARVELDEEVIADYGRAMLEQVDTEEGLQFPPCIVFREGKTFWLSDGFHRFAAAQCTGGKVPSLFCEIRQGTKRDAIFYALGANITHGLRPSAEDKRRAVSCMLRDDEWQKWADREIARQCGVAHSFVGKIRAELQPATAGGEDEEQRRTYRRHGKKTIMRTGGRRKKQRPAEDDDSDQQIEDVEVDEPSSVADPGREESHKEEVADLVAGAGALLDLSEEDKQALQAKIDTLQDRIAALESENESLRAGAAEPGGTLSEFQTAIKKWEDTVETQKTIIARLESENASLRARPDSQIANLDKGSETLSLAGLFNRAVDTLALLAGALSEGPDRWPKKVSAKSRNQQISEVDSFLSRLRGFRNQIEFYSVSEEEQA